jgi:4-carboxymuconolactone decarboxylase
MFSLTRTPQAREPACVFKEAGTTPGRRVSPGLDDVVGGHGPKLAIVDEVERLLRLLALNDEKSVQMVLVRAPECEARGALQPKVDLLVRLGALLALGASTTSLRATVRHAIEAGATESEIVGVLIAVAPAVGLARVVSTAPRLAMAIGYDIEADE